MSINFSSRLQATVRWWTGLLLVGLLMMAVRPHQASAQQSDCGDRVRMGYQYIDNCVWDLYMIFNNMSNIYRVNVTPVSPVTINWSTAAPGRSTSFTASQASWTMTGGSPFPMGSNIPVGSLSINPNGAMPQTIIIEYYDRQGKLICRETMYFDCPTEPPHGCDYPDACITDRLIISTGYDHSTNTAYAAPAQDPYWQVVGAPSWASLSLPHDAYVITPHPAWFSGATAPPSQWISAFAQYGSNQANMPPQDPYVFERCFCVCETNGELHIYMELYADNIARVYFDGNLIGQTNQASVMANFQYPTIINTWVPAGPGEHCIRIELNNDHSGSPMGVRLAGFVDQGVLIKDECCNNLSSATILKYWDKNCNGIHDDPANVNLEPGLQGWTFNLYDQFNNLIATDITDINGNGVFNNLAPGTYTICEVSQAGWTNTQPGGSGCYTFTVGAFPQSFYFEFGNCEHTIPPCDEFGDGQLDSMCCEFNLGIVNIPGNIIDIQYQIIGGVTNYINTAPCLPNATTPSNLFGQPGGVLHFMPYCNSNMNVAIGVTPTTSSGWVTINWIVRHVLADGTILECLHSSRFQCMPTPKLQCDSLHVQPFVYNGLDLSGRTFTVVNNKVPASPICRIEISLNPPPLGGSYQWAGGGLVVDGFSRSWSFPYTYIDLAGGANVSPAGAANNTVTFNLGVDYTINWTGSVTIKVIHCDGDTCDVTYSNWCAQPNPADCDAVGNPNTGNPVDVDKDRLYVASLDLDGNENTHWVSVAVENDDDVLFAAGTDYSADAAAALVQHGVGANNHALFEVQRVAGNDESNFTGRINVVVLRGEGGGIPAIRWTSYDADGNPFSTGLIETTEGAIVVGAGDTPALPQSGALKLERSVPNPANNETTIYYHLSRLMDVRLEVYDAVGRLIHVVYSGKQAAGTSSARYDTSALEAGVYYIRLSSGGQTTTMPLTIVR